MSLTLIFISLMICAHFFTASQVKGCVCEPVNTINITRLINTLQINRNKHTSEINLKCVRLCECQMIVQRGVNDSVIAVKENEREMLQDECMKLEKDLSMMEKSGDVSVLSVVIPLVALLIFISLTLLNFFIFKRREYLPGGVLGSIIHYLPPSLKNTEED